jgi:hypothetical protein
LHKKLFALKQPNNFIALKLGFNQRHLDPLPVAKRLLVKPLRFVEKNFKIFFFFLYQKNLALYKKSLIIPVRLKRLLSQDLGGSLITRTKTSCLTRKLGFLTTLFPTWINPPRIKSLTPGNLPIFNIKRRHTIVCNRRSNKNKKLVVIVELNT